MQGAIINPGQPFVTKDQGVSSDGASARVIVLSPVESHPCLLSDHKVTGREHFTEDNLLIALKSLPAELLKRENETDVGSFVLSGSSALMNTNVFWGLWR